MATNLLRNGNFEADWEEERSHSVKLFPIDEEPLVEDRGNIFTPPGWLTWFKHEPGVWSQPEVRDAWISGDAVRVRSGQKAVLLFTFFRRHDAGFMQQVPVQPGSTLKLSGWAHAWSNHDDPARPDVFAHPDDARWSEGEGVGYNHYYALEGDVTDEGAKNFTFSVGIDPTGGTDPYADTVVWGRGAHIYNAYRPVPRAEAVAQSSTVTVFLRSRTQWGFKHSDAYWDDVVLERVDTQPPEVNLEWEPVQPRVMEAVTVTVSSATDFSQRTLRVTGPDGGTVAAASVPVSPPAAGNAWGWSLVPTVAGSHRVQFKGDGQTLAQAQISVQAAPEPETWGLPREQYSRTYILLHPGAGKEWVEAILNSGAWDDRRWTIGGSADDAGIGALEDKKVIAVNPETWPSDLEEFFQTHYPRTRYVAIDADNPAALKSALEDM